MFLKYIEIQGFKSFAEPVTIEFREGITCIVGPNGSGKSNISDAVRWVLGEQSPKTLRGGKMEEVIFAGTANRKSRGMAEVTLVIDNSDKVLPIDYSEVAITRRAYRSGESGYLINRTPCRLRDIKNLIMDTGIGVDGYTIIGQGRIADIVNNKPESRREIFEEAAGIVKYRFKKAEAEGKILGCKANLDRVNDIISEIQGRINDLKSDSENAEKYIALRERYRCIEINILIRNIETFETKTRQAAGDIILLEEQVSTYMEEKEKILDELCLVQKEKEEIATREAGLRSQINFSTENLNNLRMQKNVNNEKILALNKDRCRIENEIYNIKQKMSKEKINEEGQRNQGNLLINEIEKYSKEVNEKKSIALDFTARTEELLKAMEGRKNDISSLNSTIAIKKAEIKNHKVIIDTLRERKDRILAEKDSFDDLANQIEGSLKKAQEERISGENLLKDIAGEKKSVQQDYEKETLKVNELTVLLEKYKVESGQIQARKKVLEEMESGYEGYDKGVKFIMNAGIPGILGVAADLINVDEGYETALEVALGGRLQNLICDHAESARTAIAKLKENKAGRLTFLPLSEISKSRIIGEKDIKKIDGYRGFALDHVSFNPAYKNAIEYLLNGVVLMEDLSSAVEFLKINEKRFRIVTMDGEIINPAGAITGGKKVNESIGVIRRKSEIKLLAVKLKDLETKAIKKEYEHNCLIENISAMKSKIQDLDYRQRNEEAGLLKLQSEIQSLTFRLKETMNVNRQRRQELEDIICKISEMSMAIGTMEDDTKVVEKSILNFEKTEEDIVAQYEKLKADTERAAKNLTETRLALGRKEAEKTGIEGILEGINKHIRELDEEEKGKTNELKRLHEEVDKLTQTSLNQAKSIMELEKEKSDLEESLQGLNAGRLRCERRLSENNQIKEELEKNLSYLEQQKHELELLMVKNDTIKEGFKDRLWDDYEISVAQGKEYTQDGFVMSKAVKESKELKTHMQELGEVNIGAIEEYAKVKKRYDFLIEQRDDLILSMDALNSIICEMDETIRKSFNASFDQIAENFKVSFKRLFGGGQAELCLEDKDKPLESGIAIIAQPPGKKLQNISLMSGGEKALTGIALMFAVLKARPAPFCILDEVEAALDDANIDRMIKYLKDFKEIQFALITHQKATMEHADILYGVTMAEQGVSKVISLRVGDEFEIQQ